jgi:Ca-activated chloride channel family protein
VGLIGVVLTIAGCGSLQAQNSGGGAGRVPPSMSAPTTEVTRLRADVDLVLVNVAVLDSAQKVLTGLRSDDFHILENNKEQRIRYFSTEDVPISMTVVLDASGSMESKLPKALEAARRLFEQASANDECRLLIVRGVPGAYISIEDLDDVHRVLDTIESKGYTALWDSMYLAAKDLERRAQHFRKAMVVISDGGDNRSRLTEKELRKLLEETDVQVYAVGLYNPFSRLHEERRGPAALDELATVTGGHMYTAMDHAGLMSSVENINRELRIQYVLGYMPSSVEHDGKWRKLKIVVRRASDMPSLHVDARRGYYVPQN